MARTESLNTTKDLVEGGSTDTEYSSSDQEEDLSCNVSSKQTGGLKFTAAVAPSSPVKSCVASPRKKELSSPAKSGVARPRTGSPSSPTKSDVASPRKVALSIPVKSTSPGKVPLTLSDTTNAKAGDTATESSSESESEAESPKKKSFSQYVPPGMRPGDSTSESGTFLCVVLISGNTHIHNLK